MKKITIALFTILLSTGLFSTSAFATSSIKAKVNGMVCAFCAKGIEKKLKALPQTQAVFVDLKAQIVALELKDGQTVAIDDFKQIIKDAGYEVSDAQVVNQSAQEIKAGVAE
jgi:mercuric ion binding protein